MDLLSDSTIFFVKLAVFTSVIIEGENRRDYGGQTLKRRVKCGISFIALYFEVYFKPRSTFVKITMRCYFDSYKFIVLIY